MEGVVADSSERTDMRRDCENPLGENLANGYIVYAVKQESVLLKSLSMMGHTCENEPEGNKQKQLGLCCAYNNPWKISTIGLSVALVMIVATFILSLEMLWQVPTAPSPSDAVSPSPCPPHWVRNGSQCYFLSDTKETWNASQKNCSSEGGSLVTMETPQEEKFVLNSRHPHYYWLGLWRKEGESWQRADGSFFNNTFLIRGDGLCAYMSEGKPSSTWCENKRPWICTRPIRDHQEMLKTSWQL